MAEQHPTTTKKTQSRQQPGLACEGCRTRKMRCDRQECVDHFMNVGRMPCNMLTLSTRPTCNNCKDLNIVCKPNAVRQPRGPKKGQLRALQSRILLLEQQLGDANTNQDTSNSSGESDQDPSLDTSRKSSTAVSEISLQECDTLPDGSAPLIFSDPPFDPMMLFSPPYPLMTYTGDMQDTMDMDMDALSKMNLFTPMDTFSNTLPIENNFNGPSFGLDNVHAVPLTEFQRADLNHLYFDRVHSFVPFLHRRRYFKREAASGNSSAPFTTLQHAMWTMAASMGSQFLDVRATFYATTRSMLERWELETLGEAISIEYVQALILLAIYEMTHVSYQRGCMSASRCFRLVQLLKLHKIDDPNSTPDEQGHCEIEREERRRVFWAAYMLDRFLSLFNQSPMTVSEQMILTRLPMPESPFQCSHPLRTDFLAQVISSPPDHDLSPFSETIFWVTIAGRCLAHQQESAIDLVHGGCQIEDSVARYNALSAMLLQKLENASTTAGRMVDDSSEALQLFTNMVSQTALMLLFTAMPAHDVVPTASGGFHGVHVRALAASQTFAGLLQRLSEFSSFKIQPLTPILLYYCAVFSKAHQDIDVRARHQYEIIVNKLKDFAAANKLAQECLTCLGMGR